MIQQRLQLIVGLSLAFIFGMFLSAFIAEQKRDQSHIVAKSGTLLWTPDFARLNLKFKPQPVGTKLFLLKSLGSPKIPTKNCVFVQVKMVLVANSPEYTFALHDSSLKNLHMVLMQIRLKSKTESFELVRASKTKSLDRCMIQDQI